MSKKNTVVGTLLHLKRRGHTVNGNPTWEVGISPRAGADFIYTRDSADSMWTWAASETWVGREVAVTLTPAGRVSHMIPICEMCDRPSMRGGLCKTHLEIRERDWEMINRPSL